MPNEASLRCIVCDDTKKESNVSFFRIPDDPKRCLQWLKSVNRMDLAGKSPIQLRNCRICANHFSEQCFNSDLRHRLTRGAVPTLLESSINCKMPRLDEYQLSLNHKISNAFRDERANAASMRRKTNGWEDRNISGTRVPFKHNGESTSRKMFSSRRSLPSIMYNASDLDCDAENSILTVKSHPSPEPFPASLFCEVSYGVDNETEVTSNTLWRNSALPELRSNQKSENAFPVPPVCSVSNSLDNEIEECCNVTQNETSASHPNEAGRPFPISLFSTVNNLEDEADVNNRIREPLSVVPDFEHCPENDKPYPVSLFCTSDNSFGEIEVNNITEEKQPSILPSGQNHKHVLAKSLLAQYINFLKERDIAKQKRHEQKMEELRKNNELLGKILMAIEKE